MKSILSLSLGLAFLFSLPAFADQGVIEIFDPLPTPLKLPPGNVETLPLNHTASFFGDAFRVVDCADITDARFGTCGNQFFGGLVMTDSHLNGNVTIQFFPTSATTAHFVVTMGTLVGDDSVAAAPLGYSIPVKLNSVADALTLSSGDLDLISGYATNIQWYASFANSAYLSLLNVNPKLTAPIINFPGVRGHAWASFAQRADGLLDFYFRGSGFLPLGNDTVGDPVRFPLPYCNPLYQCTSIQARGTSLHPHLYLETRSDLGFTPCTAATCPDLPTNKIQEFTVNTRYTNFGDDFDLRIPQLGGLGPGRAELQGRFEIQFGTPTGGTLPFVVQAEVPEGLFAEPPANALLGPAFRGFLLGPDGQIHFPSGVTYNQHRIVFANEVFNVAQGMIDLTSGQIIGEFEYPLYIGQTLIDLIFSDNNGRVSADPFFAQALRAPQDPDDPNYAFFEKEPNGQTMFRANLFHHRSYATYCYPFPNYLPGQCWISPDGGNLNIFVKLQAAHLPDPANPGSAVMADNRTFTSSLGDTFTYSFNVPCDAVGRQASFIYTNNNSGASGGTFTMKHPASVSCTNSKVSTAAKGNYDILALTGFGTWSKDPSGATPRFMSVSLSVDPANPYANIIVFSQFPGEIQTQPLDDTNIVLSSAENKPPTKPTP